MPSDAIDLLFDWRDERREANREEDHPQPQPDARSRTWVAGGRRKPWPPREVTEEELASSPTRICTKCGETYPETKEFYCWVKDSRSVAGYGRRSRWLTWCKDCDRRRSRKRRQREESRRDPFTNRWLRIQRSSRKRGIEWGFDNPEDLREFWDTPCHYCGGEVEQRLGLDRIENDKGYIPDNVVQCCTTCNLMKRSHSVDEWVVHMRRVLEHLESSDAE
jgi:hypothetical protein